MYFSDFNKIKLTNLETPLEKAENLGKKLGLSRLYIKRDDLFELGTGGNKIRSLEFWLGEAQKQGADVVLVAGQPVSNLCRLTAAACNKIGMECHIIHNAEAEKQPKIKNGNALLNEIMGTKIVYCGEVDEYKRGDFLQKYSENLKNQGKKPYIVGNQAIGALGYALAAEEIMKQSKNQNLELKHIFISASAGPTEVGLLFGLCMLNAKVKLHLVSVEYDREFFCKIMEDIFRKITEITGIKPTVSPYEIMEFYGEYLGKGYGIPTEKSIEVVKLLAKTQGIFIDTTYNAKVFAGLIDLAEKGKIPKNEGVCIVHTGGTAALFNQAEYFK